MNSEVWSGRGERGKETKKKERGIEREVRKRFTCRA